MSNSDADSSALIPQDGDRLNAADYEAIEETDPAPSTVNYSGTDFDVEGLVRRLDRGDIVIPTFGGTRDDIESAGFQRNFVWKRPQMDRFIESLLLGYPIPGIMLVEQQDRRYLVLDGQQRLRTMSAYYKGMHNKSEFALQNVADEFRGLTYATLPVELRRQLDNTFIQATIVKTDGTNESLDAIYQVFERLNAGGTQLTPHEIRIALFAGPMVEFLEELNQDTTWRDLFGAKSPRLRDQELILRIMALFCNAENYRRPMKKFLNDFMHDHRNLDGLTPATLTQLFHTSCETIAAGPGRAALRPGGTQLNAAVTDALFVGLMRRLQESPINQIEFRQALDAAMSDPSMGTALTRSTADEESVKARLKIFTDHLAAK